MAWFTRQKSVRQPGVPGEQQTVKTEGLWLKCDGCRQIVWRKALEENTQVCPKCGYHFRLDAIARLSYTGFDLGLAILAIFILFILVLRATNGRRTN